MFVLPLPATLESAAAPAASPAAAPACGPRLEALLAAALRLTDHPFALLSLPGAGRQWLQAALDPHAQEIGGSFALCEATRAAPGGLLHIPDLLASDRRVPGVPLVRSYTGMALPGRGGRHRGAVALLDDRPRDPDARTADLLRLLAGAVAHALDLRAAPDEALSDDSTGLASRGALQAAVRREIARQRRHGQPFTLVCLRLDPLGAAEDRPAGRARALRRAASALREIVRDEDIAGVVDGCSVAALLVGGDGREVVVTADRWLATMTAHCAAEEVMVAAGAMCLRVPPESEAEAFKLVNALVAASAAAGGGHVVFRDYHGPLAPMVASPVP